ncbi:MAG: dienelactone hydrolase family protein [Pseudomonadota bacterium]|mgnify:FL=1|nr:MAG: carboxymethylenebutenolidase [Pseudomonadota bacterium]
MSRTAAVDEAEFRSLMPEIPFTRRGFLVSSLAAGFALATQPVMAQTMIVTPADGLEAGETKIPVHDGELPAYYAAPQKASKYPVILVVQEIFGVHEHIKDVCRRFAKLGYFAVAPELYARQGDVSGMSDIPTIFKEVVSKVPDAQVMQDLDATAAWAAKHPKGDGDKLGITGFCWGGRIVWLYAAHNPKLAAGVAWYGRLVGDKTENTPRHPLDVAADIRAPVLGLYGGADQGIPVESVERMRAALKAAGRKSEIVVYPDAPHAFHADYRPTYRKAVAEDAWQRCIEWFRAHGLG